MRTNFKHTTVTAAILGAAVFFVTAAHGQAVPKPAAKDWTITVGPGPCDLTENGKPAPTQAISKGKGNKIVWQPDAKQTLSIVVHVPANCPAPFKNMTKGGKDKQGNDLWTVDCKNGKCNSGPAVKEACEGDYKYDQILGSKSCDGLIIIDP